MTESTKSVFQSKEEVIAWHNKARIGMTAGWAVCSLLVLLFLHFVVVSIPVIVWIMAPVGISVIFWLLGKSIGEKAVEKWVNDNDPDSAEQETSA